MTACRRFWIALVATLFLSGISLAQDPTFTSEFDRGRCTFSSTGSNPYLPLWPGYALLLEGEEESDGETVDIEAQVTVLKRPRWWMLFSTRSSSNVSRRRRVIGCPRNSCPSVARRRRLVLRRDVDDMRRRDRGPGAWRTGVAARSP